MEKLQPTGQIRRQKTRKDVTSQSNRLLTGGKVAIDHDSSIQTVGTLDDSRVLHADQYQAGFRFQNLNQDIESNQNVLQQAFSSSQEREQEIVRLQKKAFKLQHRIGKLQKRVEQLQNL